MGVGREGWQYTQSPPPPSQPFLTTRLLTSKKTKSTDFLKREAAIVDHFTQKFTNQSLSRFELSLWHEIIPFFNHLIHFLVIFPLFSHFFRIDVNGEASKATFPSDGVSNSPRAVNHCTTLEFKSRSMSIQLIC